MKKLMFVVGLALAAGCGSKTDKALDALEDFKTQMCKCTDASCVEGVEKEMSEWEAKMKDSGIEKSDLSDDQKAKAKEINTELRKCRRDAKKK
jgi:hypothetical protein